jgi:hypothetical protein
MNNMVMFNRDKKIYKYAGIYYYFSHAEGRTAAPPIESPYETS